MSKKKASRAQALRPALCCVLLLLAPTVAGRAMELASVRDGELVVDLDLALKGTALGSHAPEDPALYPERWTEEGLFRFRAGLNAHMGQRIDAELAYEMRSRMASGETSSAQGILPSQAEAPFRLTRMDWLIEERGDFAARHEIDRALVAFHPDFGEIVVGRQAVGLGRGRLFSAVDVFSPFSPLEVDREWRRGVDAVRTELRFSDLVSGEAIGAFGESWDDSALLGRVRGYVGNVDGELLLGKRAEDLFTGAVVSFVAWEAEIHAETALFKTDERQLDQGLLGSQRLVEKAVLGSSYTFDVRDGLTLLGEYHYSGFGLKEIEDASPRLADPVFQERYLRGDTQILCRHALGLQASVRAWQDVSLATLVLANPEDGSGVVSPSLVWDAWQNLTVLLHLFLPWGESPENGSLQSAYGGNAASAFLQVNAYF